MAQVNITYVSIVSFRFLTNGGLHQLIEGLTRIIGHYSPRNTLRDVHRNRKTLRSILLPQGLLKQGHASSHDMDDDTYGGLGHRQPPPIPLRVPSAQWQAQLPGQVSVHRSSTQFRRVRTFQLHHQSHNQLPSSLHHLVLKGHCVHTHGFDHDLLAELKVRVSLFPTSALLACPRLLG